MRNYGIICIPEYNTDIEDTMNYGQGWIAENISDPWYNSIRPYQYHHHKPDATPPYYGHFGTYGDGGFLADLDSVPTIAIDVARKLQSDVWLDRRTRVLFIEGCFVNRNNMLFTQIQIVFEFPSTGGIFMETAVATSNLYPYTTTFDFIVLFMQIIFLITILVRFVLVVANVLKTGGKSLVTVSQVFALFHLGASIAAVVFLVMRFTSTIAVLNTIRQDIGFYTSFGYVFHCDEYYSFFLGLVTFIAIIDLLKHLSFNYHLFLLNKAILAFRMELFQFTVALAVLIVGFACLIYLMYGHTERNFRSIPFGVLTLFRMTIGMIKFRKDIQVAVLSLFIIIGIYTSISTIFFMNVFISSLDNRFSHIKKLIKNGMTTYDWHLSRHFWNRLTRLITICGANKRKKTGLSNYVPTSKGESTICKLLSKVMKIIGDNDEKFERDVLQLLLRKLKRRCRRIETYNGVQYRFTMDRSAADEALILEFFDTLMRTGIDVDIYTILEASRKGLIPYGDFTEPISMVYKIGLSKRKHARTYRRDVMAGGESLCEVVIKVPSSRLSCRHTFLITLCDNYGDWRQHTAIQDITQEEVYLSATISSCPRYIMAVASDILPGISTTILQNNSFEYLLTKRGGVFYPPGLCKKIVFIFPAESVLLDTTITILLERGEKFPILHVVASGDVSGPTTVMYIRKEEQEHLPTENMPEIKLLTKEGDLEWKEGVTGRQTAGKDLCVEIDSLQKGVKISVSACESNYVRNLARTANKCLDHNKKILFGIHRKFIPTKHWRQIGHALGFSQESLAKIENKKNRSLQEKTCVVLERWLRLNPGKNLYEILTDWV
ncbi:uncharacterized protein LOC132554253 [Ylistrum balloti]|uniref:uncharacterized protein LOC132554253 n=1 Tax=Ylistrum balloti TaxID=509963 RepID=UPI002905EFE8|nr:uncharacterized protein LOC132554253 [Ylistrum balloti]